MELIVIGLVYKSLPGDGADRKSWGVKLTCIQWEGNQAYRVQLACMVPAIAREAALPRSLN